MRGKYLVINSILIVFYGILAYCIATPRVSSDYYNYYISKSSDLSPTEIKLLHHVVPKTKYAHNSTNLGFTSGWSAPEEHHRWSDGRRSSITFKIKKPQDFDGFLVLHFGTLGTQKITILMNGSVIYSDLIDTSDRVLEIPFKKTLLSNGINTLEFDLPDARQPGNGDSRTLALALKSLQIR